MPTPIQLFDEAGQIVSHHLLEVLNPFIVKSIVGKEMTLLF